MIGEVRQVTLRRAEAEAWLGQYRLDMVARTMRFVEVLIEAGQIEKAKALCEWWRVNDFEAEREQNGRVA